MTKPKLSSQERIEVLTRELDKLKEQVEIEKQIEQLEKQIEPLLKQIEPIQTQIKQLQAKLNPIMRMSLDARARISEGQRQRWQRWHAAKQNTTDASIEEHGASIEPVSA